MTTEGCREWRGLLGAYALDQLPVDERAGLEAHLEGCAECRAELDSLAGVARLMPLADPERFATAPSPPTGLGDRVLAAVESERRAGGRRARGRRRRRFGLALSGAVATAAAVLAIVALGGGGGEAPPQREVAFRGRVHHHQGTDPVAARQRVPPVADRVDQRQHRLSDVRAVTVDPAVRLLVVTPRRPGHRLDEDELASGADRVRDARQVLRRRRYHNGPAGRVTPPRPPRPGQAFRITGRDSVERPSRLLIGSGVA